MTHPAKRIAINTGFLYARMVITVFISLYATRLVLNALGVNDFGIYNVVGGAISMLLFLNNAMTTATQRFMSYAEGEGNNEKQRYIFNMSIVLHVITAVMVVIILEIAGYFLLNGLLKIAPERLAAAKLIYQFLIVSTFFSIISVPYDAIINAHENMLLVAILGIIEAVIKLGIAIFITKAFADKLIVYGFLMAILSVFLLILRQIYCRIKYSEVRINIHKYYSKPLINEMTGFAGWSFLGASTSMIGFYGQGIVLNMFFGTIVNAAQGVATQISSQLGSFAGTMLKALNPVIVKSEGAGNRDRMLKASSIGSKLSFFLMMIFYIPVLIEMPYIFHLWLKSVPEYSIIFCRLILLRNLIEQLYITLGSSIAAVGNIKKYQIYISLFYLIPLFISYFLFFQHYPPYMLYVVFLISSLANLVITIYYANINCGLSILLYMKEVVFRCFISFCIILLLSTIPIYILPIGFIQLFSVVVISFSAFLITTWFIGITTEERLRIKRITAETFNKSVLPIK